MVTNNFNKVTMSTTLIFNATNESELEDLKRMMLADDLYYCLSDVKRVIDAKIQHGVYNEREGEFLRSLHNMIDIQGLHID